MSEANPDIMMPEHRKMMRDYMQDMKGTMKDRKGDMMGGGHKGGGAVKEPKDGQEHKH